MFLKLSKIFYILLIFYMAWFQVAFFHVNYLLLLLGIGLVVCLLLHIYIANIKINKTFPIELNMWIIFGLVVGVFGLKNAIDQSLHVNSIITYFQFLIVTWAVITISLFDRKIDFFVDTYVLLTFISAITTLIIKYDFGGGRLSMGPDDNPNTLSVVMVVGIGLVLFKTDLKGIFKTMFLLFIAFLLLYVTVLTGSRKSIFAVIILLLFWIILVFIPYMSKKSFSFKLKIFLIVSIIVTVTVYIYSPMLETSVLFKRLFEINSGDQQRIGMYYEALQIFKEFPLFGAGMQQFRTLSIYDTYSHSTYAEAIANTGFIGSIIYFSSYVLIGYKLFIKSLKKDNANKVLNETRILLAMFVMILFLGIGIIHFYTPTSFIFFGITIAYLYLPKFKPINENLEIQDNNQIRKKP